jgi:hypothetical protein
MPSVLEWRAFREWRSRRRPWRRDLYETGELGQAKANIRPGWVLLALLALIGLVVGAWATTEGTEDILENFCDQRHRLRGDDRDSGAVPGGHLPDRGAGPA